jgi:hypothetical protein
VEDGERRRKAYLLRPEELESSMRRTANVADDTRLTKIWPRTELQKNFSCKLCFLETADDSRKTAETNSEEPHSESENPESGVVVQSNQTSSIVVVRHCVQSSETGARVIKTRTHQ